MKNAYYQGLVTTWINKILIGCFPLVAMLYAGSKSKQKARLSHFVESERDYNITDDDFSRGFVLSRVGTNEVFDFSAPADAVINNEWLIFGAANDWFYLSFPEFWSLALQTNEIDKLRVFHLAQLMP